jgi:hypothetical protein
LKLQAGREKFHTSGHNIAGFNLRSYYLAITTELTHPTQATNTMM